jgi:hypothetical protein
MIGGVAAVAAVRTFPFRVFSFPSEIVEPSVTFDLGGFDLGGFGDFYVQPMYDFYSLPNGAVQKQTLFYRPGHYGVTRGTDHESRIILRDAQGKR